jgi:uncharacterized protein YceK
MDKKEEAVIKRALGLCIILAFILSLSGCGTLKGAYNGAKEDWQSLKKADDWMKKNLW